MTRARAKLHKQQVNLFRSETLIDENFILPKSYYLCLIRYEGASIARGGEEQLDKKLDVKLDMELAMKLDKKTSQGRPREEWEASARGGDVPAGAQPGQPAVTPCRPATGPVRPAVRPDPCGLNGFFPLCQAGAIQ